jgi:hypothetical protein
LLFALRRDPSAEALGYFQRSGDTPNNSAGEAMHRDIYTTNAAEILPPFYRSGVGGEGEANERASAYLLRTNRSLPFTIIADVKHHLRSRPFEPFSIVTSAGQRYPVPSAEHAGIHPRGHRVLVWLDDGAPKKKKG